MDIIMNAQMAQCGHNFCFNCIFAWVSKNKQCPACRCELTQAPTLNLSLVEQVETFIHSMGKNVEALAHVKRLRSSKGKFKSSCNRCDALTLLF
jgi:hypothetical protein